MEEIVIWGAGRAAVKKLRWAELAGCRVMLFVDNDSEKWGMKIGGIPVCPPEIIIGKKYVVMFPDFHGKEIEAQLDNMSYQGRRIGFDKFKKETVCKKDVRVELTGAGPGNKTSYIFDAYFPGTNWGGVEGWSCMVAGQLSNLGVETRVLCGPNKKFDGLVRNCSHFSDEDEVVLIRKMAAEIASHLPCVFITQGSLALYAAQIVKNTFPGYIKLVAVAHGDEPNTYENLGYWSHYVDRIICISQKIREEFRVRYGLGDDFLLYRPNPVSIPEAERAGKRRKRDLGEDGTVRVGFAARLRKEQKRVHLIPEIIERCAAKNLDLEFEIAGEGECLDELLAYVSQRNLGERVHILGWIPPSKMAEFWSRQDIYLNISDFEGMSLAMLEAMACGAVPVVTDVSGVRDLIEDGVNGFVVPVENWLEAADRIETLVDDKGMLQRAGACNMRLIWEKCNISGYARWLMDMF